ncbi:MAG: ATP-binding cassette domain-containing protein [Bacteroidetes bacterium]|nr:MAG: ATP-binding cassette domain-containing protein [Bacteroidota bacterium]
MADRLDILVEQAGKKFGRDWIFKDFNYRFESGKSYAILGHNGSGKSTLLMALAGFYAISRGHIKWEQNGAKLEDDVWYKHYALSSPMLELPEDFTIDEFLSLHFQLKPMKADWSIARIYEESGLDAAKNKALKQLSSGMRQRVKLLAAMAADVPVLFLDEPCTNLDDAGVDLYKRVIGECQNQLVLVASNMKVEYDFCEVQIQMEGLR